MNTATVTITGRKLVKLSKTDNQYQDVLFRKHSDLPDYVEFLHPQLAKWCDAKNMDTHGIKWEGQ